MSKTPLVYKTTYRVRFSDLDPLNHVGTARYAALFVDHRMDALRENVGWDLKTLGKLPFAPYVRRIEVDYIRPALGDQELTITSSVLEFRGHDAHIECVMTDAAGNPVAKCTQIVAYFDKATGKAADWPPSQTALFFEPEPAPAT